MQQSVLHVWLSAFSEHRIARLQWQRCSLIGMLSSSYRCACHVVLARALYPCRGGPFVQYRVHSTSRVKQTHYSSYSLSRSPYFPIASSARTFRAVSVATPTCRSSKPFIASDRMRAKERVVVGAGPQGPSCSDGHRCRASFARGWREGF